MKNNLQGNIQFINLNNDNNIDMYINNVKQTIFNNTIQFEIALSPAVMSVARHVLPPLF